jgi:hypothetical protein
MSAYLVSVLITACGALAFLSLKTICDYQSPVRGASPDVR